MLSPTLLRRHPELVKAGLRRRGVGPQVQAALARWLALDAERRTLTHDGADRQRVAVIEAEMRQVMLRLPNLPAPDVPAGQDASANVEVSRWGSPPEIPSPRAHDAIATDLGVLDATRATRLAGPRFPLLVGQGARLARVLAAFLLDMHTQYGYVEVAPPHLLRPATLEGSAHMPAHAGEMYAVPADGLYLSPTAEAQLVGMVDGRLMSERELPLAYVAATPCFRREAGSAGAATRGLLRQHQFDKVELVRIARSEDAEAELARILADAERPLRALELHYRVVALCAGELPFTAERTYDIEVWLPGEARFVEISSVSLCGEFQARRLGVRYRPDGGKPTRHPVTLNASALPIGRTLAALLEAGQQPDGSVALAPVLVSRFGAPALSPR